MSTNMLRAQQTPNFTLYNFNMNIINPAYAGSNDVPEINAAYRSQWIGVDEAPKTQTLTYSMPFKNKLGIGISLVNDRVFVLEETSITVDVSYKLKLSGDHIFYFGIKSGGAFTNIDLNSVGAPTNDPLFTTNQSFFNPHLGAGGYLQHKKFYITFSSPNFLKASRNKLEDNISTSAADDMPLYLGGGYTFELSQYFKLTPAVMVRSISDTPVSYDVSATLDIIDKVKTGVNYRVDETLSFYTLMSIIDKVRFGFSYELASSKLADQDNNNGSLELMFRYQFK